MITLILVGAQIILADPPVATSANYQIFRDVDTTAGVAASTNYSLTMIAGEPSEVGLVTSTNYRLRSSYWFPSGPDVAISKTVTPAIAAPGAWVTYTLVFSNVGSDVATGVVITDRVPPSVTIASRNVVSSGAKITDTGDSLDYVWEVQDLDIDAWGVITITGVLSDPLAAGIFTNTAEIDTTTADGNPNNNIANAKLAVRVPAGAVLINEVVTFPQQDWSGNGPINQGTDEWVELYMVTAGLDLTGWTIELIDATPVIGDLTSTGAFDVSTYTGNGSFNNTAVGDYLVLLDVDGGGQMSNNVEILLKDSVGAVVDRVELGNGAPNGGSSGILDEAVARSPNGVDTDNDANDFVQQKATIGITNDAVDLVLVKTVVPALANPGGRITYTLTYTNTGPGTATGVVITDRVPPSVTHSSLNYTSVGAAINATGNISYVWNVANLAPGTGGVITITGDLSATLPGGHVFTNTAEIAATTEMYNLGDDESSAVITVTNAKLEITKEVDKPAPDEGWTIVYTLTVTNDGPDDATNVGVSDTLPSGVTYKSDDGVGTTTTYDGISRVLAWSVDSLNDGYSKTLHITVTVDGGTAGTTITNTAVISESDQGDTAGDNQDKISIAVAGADLRVEKTVDNFTPNEGDMITYVITVTNLGSANITGAVVSDTLPGGVTWQSDTGSGTYIDGAWTIGSLNKGDHATLQIKAKVNENTAGRTITNTAVITESSRTDPVSKNDETSAPIKPQGADLKVVKTVNDHTPKERDTITYTLTVTNTGPADTTGVVVSDTLPVIVAYQSHSGGTATYDAGSRILVWSADNLNNGYSKTLHVLVKVITGTWGVAITNTAAISESDRTDLFSANNAGDALIAAQEVDAVIEQVDPDQGQNTILIYTDTHGYTTTIEIPAGAVTDVTTLIYTPIHSPTQPAPADMRFSDNVFTLEAYLDPILQPSYIFKTPVTITIHYTDTNMTEAEEAALVLEYWDGEAWVDAACDVPDPYVRDLVANRLSVPLCHLSPFALLIPTLIAPVGGVTEPANLLPSLQPLRPEFVACTELVEVKGWFLLAAMIVTGAIAAAAFKRRAA